MTAESNKTEVTRRYAKYIFLDVVRFSKRSAEAQSDIVNQINTIVRSVLENHAVEDDDCILIPTGDGMCITLISPHLPYDIHMQVALSILESLDTYNKETKNETRQFQVRIGVNQNTDILVTDINNRRNVAGAGINMAARIMDKADGNQILVSQTVYDELQPSEQYMGKFHPFDAEGKHELKFRVYQYIGKGHVGLDCSRSTEFEKKQTLEPKLSKIVAYYFANAIKHRQFIVQNQGHGQNNYTLTVMLWLLATDSEGESAATEIAPYEPSIYGDGKATLDEIFSHYETLDFDIISTLARFILDQLSQYGRYWAAGGIGYMPLFINGRGREKLKKDWPDIWKELNLDKAD